ncbi:hypothetical protein [Vulcanococcus limneticus]|uniref:hypothetical protein n=1 Tax=Vulcanococcus limneticus TaxID=2170428 RepID=UPI000B994FAF|nr:hypothetical protein [Vulcanococcus limneticus]MCP9791692.1 hypothetical protein [Vulcanococcus limneticus MW73D5]MCP9894569.1 hypothetical protein [Vulcanococcus limneticus Candia 3F8]MCP9897025.1 hypothetical protein [Vulcanococcus limneticus Candia 3B3]
MVQAAPAGTAAGPAPQSRPRLWLGPLVAGLSFGLGYGLTQRLVALNVTDLVRFGQNFDVQPFPGTSLDSLRLRFGAEAQQIRGILDLDQLERQQAAPAAEPPRESDPLESTAPDPSRESDPSPAPAAVERAPELDQQPLALPTPAQRPEDPSAPATEPAPAGRP